MHDVLDLRDLVPDEAEQLANSGHEVTELWQTARSAAERNDIAELERIAAQLERIAASEADEDGDSDAALVASARSVTPREVDRESLPDKILGAWQGRCVANTIGKPVEGLRREEVTAYLQAVGTPEPRFYLPLLDPLPPGVSHLHESAPFATLGSFDAVPRDDDLDWTILGLSMQEEFGPEPSTTQIAQTWLTRLPFQQTFTAERAAYRNLINGVPLAQTARVRNPYREWIGALIRADIYGYTDPGDPGRAARRAIADARLSHVGNGVLGEMWAAALVSACFTSQDPDEALATALAVLPPVSRLRQALAEAQEIPRATTSAAAALDWAHERFGHLNWVHTINNAVLISIGLRWGEDFGHAVGLTISGAWDTDSNAATVGSAWGAMHGTAAVPAELLEPTHGIIRSAVMGFDRVPIKELADRTLALALESLA